MQTNNGYVKMTKNKEHSKPLKTTQEAFKPVVKGKTWTRQNKRAVGP